MTKSNETQPGMKPGTTGLHGGAPRQERKAPTGTITGECLQTDWQTPPRLVEPVTYYFQGQIPLDPCGAPGNPTGAKVHWIWAGLTWDWGPRAFVNPPYGKALPIWLAKATLEANKGYELVLLLPCARWEQEYFHDMLEVSNAVCYIRKRVNFVNPRTGDEVGGNPYANMFLGCNIDWKRWTEAFAPVGFCQQLTESLRDYLLKEVS